MCHGITRVLITNVGTSIFLSRMLECEALRLYFREPRAGLARVRAVRPALVSRENLMCTRRPQPLHWIFTETGPWSSSRSDSARVRGRPIFFQRLRFTRVLRWFRRLHSCVDLSKHETSIVIFLPLPPFRARRRRSINRNIDADSASLSLVVTSFCGIENSSVAWDRLSSAISNRRQ